MTETEIRVAIAEACGWKSTDMGWWFNETTSNPTDEMVGVIQLPDYLHDLNAMHEAEKTLAGEQCNDYQNQLIKVAVELGKLFPSGRAYPMDGYVIHATAAQRAEAFLLTIGKWKD